MGGILGPLFALGPLGPLFALGEEKLRRFQKRGSGAEKSGVRGDWDGKEVNIREQREGNASEKKENGGKEPEKGETQV